MKRETAPFFFLGAVVSTLSIFLFSNVYIYPDSFIYILLAKGNSWLVSGSGFSYETLIKPASFYWAAGLNYISVLTPFINSLLIVLVTFIWYMQYKETSDKKNKNSNSNTTLFLLLIFSLATGNTLMWMGKISAEIVTLFLTSIFLILLYRTTKQTTFLNVITVVLSLLLSLFRPEFIIIMPLLIGSSSKRAFWPYITIAALVIPLVVAIQHGLLKDFLLVLLLPVLVTSILAILIQKSKSIESFIIRVIPWCILIFFGIIVSNYLFVVFIAHGTKFLFASALLAMFLAPVLFASFSYITALNTKTGFKSSLLGVLLTIIVLTSIYYLKAYTNFRYFLYITPFVLYIVLEHIEQLRKHLPLVVIILLAVLGSIISLNTYNTDIARENYWVNRFDTFKESHSQYTQIYSNTPLITLQRFSKGESLCNAAAIQTNSIVVIDDYSLQLCPEKITLLKNSYTFDPLAEYNTEKFVELERYYTKGQHTSFYLRR